MILSSITLPISAIGIIGQLYTCPNMPSPKVNINLNQENFVIDNSKDRDQLAQLNINSLSPIYGGEFPLISGLTASNITVSAETSFAIASNPILKKACIAIEHVNVNLNYAPIVYVYKNFHPNSCMYREVMMHELQHVQIDRNAFGSFRDYIQKATDYVIDVTKFDKPFDSEYLESKKINMAKSVSAAVSFATKKMQEQLKERQRQLDSHEEYTRMSHVCPNENKF